MSVVNSSEFDITSYVNQLELSSKTKERAEAILVDAEQAGLTSRKAPESLIAAALYIASILEGERRTQAKIGHVLGVSPHTIQTRYKELVHELEIRSG